MFSNCSHLRNSPRSIPEAREGKNLLELMMIALHTQIHFTEGDRTQCKKLFWKGIFPGCVYPNVCTSTVPLIPMQLHKGRHCSFGHYLEVMKTVGLSTKFCPMKKEEKDQVHDTKVFLFDWPTLWWIFCILIGHIKKAFTAM